MNDCPSKIFGKAWIMSYIFCSCSIVYHNEINLHFSIESVKISDDVNLKNDLNSPLSFLWRGHKNTFIENFFELSDRLLFSSTYLNF